MLKSLNNIRESESMGMNVAIKNIVLCIILGLIMGVISKFLDELPINYLPSLLQTLDFANFLSRMGIWLFIALCLSVYTKNPFQSSLNVFFFFSSMIFSYFIYTYFLSGFYPQNYIILWIMFTLLSPLLAFIVWYSKGDHIISTLISVSILTIMFRQTFAFGFWYFDLLNLLELILLVLTHIVLYKNMRQMTLASMSSFFLFLLTSHISIFGGWL